MNFFILLVSLLPTLMLADHLTVADHDLHHLKCDMDCHNNGVCRFFSRERHDLQKRMQSGRLVQECICPMGYWGMSCDIILPGRTCTGPDCHCVAADRISPFAGAQCRKPFTEYCASLTNSVGGHISYCTNGGKCRGDLIAAQISPGNTANNYVFQHTGCFCPPEFIGEHCEVLNVDGVYHPELHNHHTIYHPTHTTTNTSTSDNKGSLAILLVCVGAFTILGVILARKLQYTLPMFALRRRNPGSGAPPVSVISLKRYSDHGEDHHHQVTYDDAGYESEPEDEVAVAFQRRAGGKLPSLS